MISLSRFLSKLRWKILPDSSHPEKSEIEEWFDEIFPIFIRTEEEESKFEAGQKQRYLQELTVPLRKHEAHRVTDDEKWKRTILSLRNLPIRFRIKFIETSHITHWQTDLEQGVYDSHFVFPGHGSIPYNEIEWLELNASQLQENDLEHFGDVVYNTRIMQCHVLPWTMQIWRLYGHYEIFDQDTMVLDFSALFKYEEVRGT